MITIALFNNLGGVGKTTLAYHLAHMFPRLGYSILAVDLDPQANLTSAFFEDDTLERVWDEEVFGQTVLTCVQPILDGTGDIAAASPLRISPRICLLCGDLGLSQFEDKLSESWPKGFANDQAALRATSAFYRMIQDAGKTASADVAILDVGPNLGAINRSALLAADFLIIPLAADLFSLQGLKNLGPAVRHWRRLWTEMLEKAKVSFPLPAGRMEPLGYVMLQHAVRADRPAKGYDRWLQRVPGIYREFVLGEGAQGSLTTENYCLGTLRNYGSLMPMAQEARKPMFDLSPADGAIGSHAQLVRVCERDFRQLAEAIALASGLSASSEMAASPE